MESLKKRKEEENDIFQLLYLRVSLGNWRISAQNLGVCSQEKILTVFILLFLSISSWIFWRWRLAKRIFREEKRKWQGALCEKCKRLGGGRHEGKKFSSVNTNHIIYLLICVYGKAWQNTRDGGNSICFFFKYGIHFKLTFQFAILDQITVFFFC